MGILLWIVMGLLAGLLAKWIVPGRDPGGILVTIFVGIAGAIVGGMLGSAFGIGGITGFDIRSLVIATGGAIGLLYLYRLGTPRLLSSSRHV